MNYSFWGITPHRQRVEWSTRDTINRRQLDDTFGAGAKTVTPAMLAAHPSRGAYTMIPTASQKDPRTYKGTGVEYFPDARNQGERPTLPPKSLFQNPWLNNYDIESGDVIQELKGAVKENNLFLTEDVSKRMISRTWTHQWIPQGTSLRMSEQITNDRG
jgi:hypothetical protein